MGKAGEGLLKCAYREKARMCATLRTQNEFQVSEK